MVALQGHFNDVIHKWPRQGYWVVSLYFLQYSAISDEVCGICFCVIKKKDNTDVLDVSEV